jgi:gliding motility-associated-like protein
MKPSYSIDLLKNTFIRFFMAAVLCSYVNQGFAQLPVPDFSADRTTGCSPLIVNFTDLSANATSWEWNLGNGVISTQKNPSTVYSQPGNYTVTLTATNANGSTTLTRVDYIVVSLQPQIEFNADKTTGCFPLKVQFTETSTYGTPSAQSFLWNFGDGTTSTAQNPFHTYTTAGTYFVSLTIINESGCSKTLVKPAFITVTPGITSGFSFSTPVNCKPPETISFANSTTGAGTLSFEWDFGDGNSSTAVNPSNNYSALGPFNVRLITTSTNGCADTLTKVLTLNNYQPVIGAPALGCVNRFITFQNQSIPLPVSSAWSFGDGTTSTQTNPLKRYSTTGTFTVKLVNQYPTCKDSAIQTITINPNPVADFRSLDTISCKAPHTVSFSDLSTNAVSWAWDFGDGNSSTLQNPVHTYNSLGNFTVRLIVTNSFGCTDTIRKNAYIKIQKPIFNPVIQPSEGCRLLNVGFVANSTSIDSITNWFWDFGDGNSSALRNTSHIYDSGTYTIKLRIQTTQGCIDSIVLPNRVRAGTKPTALFSATPQSVCAFSSVQFNDLSTGNPDQWLWDFGDGTTSTLQNPVHVYNDTGQFTIQLQVFNNRCPDVSTQIQFVKVLPPIARFNYQTNCNISNLQFSFFDRSVVATSWNWNFGDGNSSTLQNPIHNYTTPGNYRVTLSVTNGSCTHQTLRDISVIDETPDFSASAIKVCKRQPVQFNRIVSNPANIVSYNWNFGDGATSTVQSPIHAYANPGTYNVRLITTDLNGCRDTVLKTAFIRVNGPTASFTANAVRLCAGSPLQLNNTSSTDGVNPINNVIWDMGNGIRISNPSNPFNYVYSAGGRYSIRLIVRDTTGCADSILRTNIITIQNPKARFKVDTPSCPGAPLNFTNQSFDATAPSYVWFFGDGSSSSLVNPTHAYAAPGVYTVKLLLTEAFGCKDSAVVNVNIRRPKAAFKINDSISICKPFEAKFTDTSIFANSYLWNFGDGQSSILKNPRHYYSVVGNYNVKLVVTSPGGCKDSVFKTIRIGTDTGTLNYTPLRSCAPFSVNLQTRTDVPLNYTWDLGDGNIITTTDSNLTHIYEAGFYVPKVIIKDGSGCAAIITGIDTIKALGSRPNFGADTALFCDRGTVQFSDSTITPDVITSYLWNFGDGTTSTAVNPIHSYNTTGLYTVSLTIRTQTGCVNTKTKIGFVKIVPSPQISITGNTSYCMPANFVLQGNWLNPDTSVLKWQWNIDGQIFNTQNPPSINRSTAGNVSAQLIATNGTGCKDTANQTVVVHPLPNLFAGNDTTICLGSFASLKATGASSYTWTPATNLSCTNCFNPQSRAADAIQYVVTGTSTVGCENRDSVIVRVKKPFRISVSKGDTLCVGESLQLNASGAENYSWSPTTGLNNSSIPNPIARPQATTLYQVVGFDSLNCFRDSLNIPVVVYPYPSITAKKDTVIRAGSSIILNPQLSSDVTNILWSPPDFLSCTTCASPTASPLKTTSYRIVANNRGGCISLFDIKVIVVCNKDNVFIPNAFTPNGDGNNDRFYVNGLGLQSVKSLRIYNRWGNKVFESTYTNSNTAASSWDGTYNGQPQPAGVYTYAVEVICGEGIIIPISGTFILIR